MQEMHRKGERQMAIKLPREGEEREEVGAVRESLSVKVTFMLRSELQDGNTEKNISGKSTSGRGKSQSQGPEVGTGMLV